MSLEVAIQENTKAINELIAAIKSGATIGANAVQAAAGNVKPSPAATATAATASTAAAPAAPETKAEASAPVSYDEAKTPFLALWKKDNAKANEILAEFGVNNLKFVPAEKLGEAKAKIEAALNG